MPGPDPTRLLTILLLATPAQSLVGRVGIRPLMAGGFVVVAAGLAWLARMRSTASTSPTGSRASWR
jgi:hypothetical protein